VCKVEVEDHPQGVLFRPKGDRGSVFHGVTVQRPVILKLDELNEPVEGEILLPDKTGQDLTDQRLHRNEGAVLDSNQLLESLFYRCIS